MPYIDFAADLVNQSNVESEYLERGAFRLVWIQGVSSGIRWLCVP